MTTSAQPEVLTNQELAAMRAIAADCEAPVDEDIEAALRAKGMLQAGAPRKLTPAGDHAIHIGEGGVLPGLDN